MFLLFDEIFTIILIKYSDYNNVFLVKYIVELLEYTKINDHAIKLKKGKQLLFKSIYSLELIKLEILKIYIKTNLANSFIWLFKSSVGIFILFDWKLDKNLRFYINYQSFYNFTIKNWYTFLLIRKFLDWPS